jgi:hypothetical protein
LQFKGNRLGLKGADPDRHRLFLVGILQDHNWRVRELIETDVAYLNLYGFLCLERGVAGRDEHAKQRGQQTSQGEHRNERRGVGPAAVNVPCHGASFMSCG